MLVKPVLAAASALALLLVLPGAAWALQIQGDFAGSVSAFMVGDASDFGGFVDVGTSLTGSYAIDSNAPDLATGSDQVGTYAGDAIILQLGSFLFGAPSHVVQVVNATGSPVKDTYLVSKLDLPLLAGPASVTLVSFSISLQEFGAGFFADDSLPMSLPALTQWDEVSAFIVGCAGAGPCDIDPIEGDFFEVEVTLSSFALVPEPRPASLVALAACLLLGATARRTARNLR